VNKLRFQTWKLVCSFTFLSFCFCKMTSQTVEEKTLTNKISTIFFSTSFSFSTFYIPSTVSIPSFSILFFFYFVLQPMLILTDLSWCHKFELHFMSLLPQIRGAFIKIKCFKMKSRPSQKKMGRVHRSNITLYFSHTLPRIEFDPALIQMKACW